MSGVDVRHGHRHRHAAAVLHLSGVQIWKVATRVHALALSLRVVVLKALLPSRSHFPPRDCSTITFALYLVWGCRTREREGVVSRQGVGCRGMDRIVSVGV